MMFMVSFEKVKAKVKELVNEKRFEHCVLVSKEAEKLAKHYGLDAKKAKIVGMAHDIAKDFSNEENEEWVTKYNLDRKILDDRYRKLIHADLGSVVCKEWFSFDNEMCKAIKCHTVATPDMSDFDKIIFIADKIGRKEIAPDLIELKDMAYQSLDKGMIFFLENQAILLKSRGRELLPETVELLNKMKEKEKKMKIVLASNNQHKVKEFKKILKDKEILTMNEIGYVDDIEENGTTFAENALIKAETIHKYLKEKGLDYVVIADDSGLCCEALDGAPGVYSARYAGGHGNNQANRDKLRKELKDKDRKAYFICNIVVYYNNGEHKLFEGRTYGEIIDEERGSKDFGYDCIFYSDDLKKTFGEATEEEKNSVSHRGRAIEKMVKEL